MSFPISVRWSIYIINSVDKPNFRVSLLHRRSTTVSIETNPLYYRCDVHMFSVVHRQHFSLYCRVFLETLACYPSCSSPEGYCWEIKQQQTRILVWIFSSCIRVNKIGRRIPTSTLWAPPGIWSYHVRGFPQSTTAFRANVPLAVPKVRKRSPKRFSAKKLEEVTVLLFMRRRREHRFGSTVATMRPYRGTREFVPSYSFRWQYNVSKSQICYIQEKLSACSARVY